MADTEQPITREPPPAAPPAALAPSAAPTAAAPEPEPPIPAALLADAEHAAAPAAPIEPEPEPVDEEFDAWVARGKARIVAALHAGKRIEPTFDDVAAAFVAFMEHVRYDDPHGDPDMRPVRYVATAADVAAGFTPPIPVDYLHVDGQYGLTYQAAAGTVGVGGTVQFTIDNPFSPPPEGLLWQPAGGIVLTAGAAQFTGAVMAFRLTAPVLGDILKVTPQGGSPGV
jgi:hypothetical protein